MPPRQRSESKTGLVVTLVIFILLTLGLGVATYFGFAEQDALKGQKAEAEKKLKTMTDERDWYKFQAHMYRAYMGYPPTDIDRKDIQGKKRDLAKNSLGIANAQKDKQDVTNFVATMDKELRDGAGRWWDAERVEQPPVTFKSRLADSANQYAELEKTANNLKSEKDAADKKALDAERLAAEQEKKFRKEVVDLTERAKKDRQDDRDAIDRLRREKDKENEEKGKENKARVEAEAKSADAAKRLARREKELTDARGKAKEMEGKLEENKEKLRVVYREKGVDPRAVETAALDSKALEKVRNWDKDWKIVRMDRRGTTPYINLGSADGVTPQLTFSVHSTDASGKLSTTPKGTVEVIQVAGPHLSRVQVTSVKDPRNDPLVTGDRLFNATWDPARRRHVAIAGIVKLSGEGKEDDTAAFIRLLERQGVVVDAYVDRKTLSVKGKGITADTDYLILGEGSEALGEGRTRDKEAAERLNKAITSMRQKASAEAVPLIGLQKYLDLIGYRPLRGSRRATTGGYAGGSGAPRGSSGTGETDRPRREP
jgi:hypothetical protein